MTTRLRGIAASLVSAALVVALTSCAAALAAPVATDRPATAEASSARHLGELRDTRSVAVLGDSISVGYNACGRVGQCKAANWATGDSPAVQSVAARLGAGTTTHDLAFPGKRMRNMVDELSRLSAPADLIVVLAGANDLCQPSVTSMTPAAVFRERVGELLAAVEAKDPKATVLMMSVPDVVSLAQVQGVPPEIEQRRIGSAECGSVLGDREHGTDAAAIAAVQHRLAAYDAAIRAECLQDARCIDDGGALSAHRFTSDEVSTVDYFHPSEMGQSEIAAIAWAALLRGRA